MNELELLRRIARRVPARAGAVVAGIGDDCAVFRAPGAKEDLLFTTDMLIEDVHFRRATHTPEAVGWKALARGLSDIAAMGGTPRFCLLSLALAPWTDTRWVDRFYAGLLRLAGREGVVLAGGDLSHACEVACDIVVCGAAPRGKALRRDGAKPGDVIYVSGRLGGSALGLETMRGAAWRRHLRPQPRLALGRFLREKLRATACMDLSDGLSIDLLRLGERSGVAAELTGEIPIDRGATLRHALDGGEDYELLFTVRPRTAVPPEFEGLPLTAIGRIREGEPGHIEFAGRPLRARGYDHFARRSGRSSPACSKVT
jgi:thiamine-monophosphate kinase